MIMVFSLLSLQVNASSSEIHNMQNPKVGNDIIAENVSIWNNGEYYCITEKATPINTPISPCGIVPQHVTEYFVHNIYDRNGDFIAKFNTTVTGDISGSNPSIVSIQGYFTDKVISTSMSYTTYLVTCKENICISMIVTIRGGIGHRR